MNLKVASLTFIGLMASIAVSDTLREMAMLSGAIVVVLYGPPGGPPKALWTRLRPFYYFAGIAVIFGGMSNDEPFLMIGPLAWGGEALARAAMSGLRLVAIGVAASWLTLQVGTASMVAGLWHVGQKVKKIGIDVSPLLFGMAIAIRFLPILQQEAAMLRIGWEARGASLYKGLFGKIRYIMGLIVPLLAAGLRRAEAFATAIELRVTAAGGEGVSQGFSSAFFPREDRKDMDQYSSSDSYLQTVRAAMVPITAWLPFGLNIVNWLQ